MTAWRYNQLGQVTNTVLMADNLNSYVGFDAADNVRSSTDFRGFTTSKSWSPTRHLTGTVFPWTPQGVATITNFYDGRDLLTRTLDPLQQPTLYTNGAAQRLLSVTDPLQRTTRFGSVVEKWRPPSFCDWVGGVCFGSHRCAPDETVPEF